MKSIPVQIVENRRFFLIGPVCDAGLRRILLWHRRIWKDSVSQLRCRMEIEKYKLTGLQIYVNKAHDVVRGPTKIHAIFANTFVCAYVIGLKVPYGEFGTNGIFV